jgi:hypothetical protein
MTGRPTLSCEMRRLLHAQVSRAARGHLLLRGEVIAEILGPREAQLDKEGKRACQPRRGQPAVSSRRTVWPIANSAVTISEGVSLTRGRMLGP